MYIPRSQSKIKKQQKGKVNYKIFSKKNVFKNLSVIGLKSIEMGKLSSKQLITLKQLITKKIKKFGRLIIKVFPQTSVTKKPLEIRMGKGKGAITSWVSKIKPGCVFCYILSSNKIIAKKAFESIKTKLPLKTKIICI